REDARRSAGPDASRTAGHARARTARDRKREGQGDRRASTGSGRPRARGREQSHRAESRVAEEPASRRDVFGVTRQPPSELTMREPTIARNYAETLLELAQKTGDLRGWGEMIDRIADAMENDRRLRVFLESPRVSAQRKNEIIERAFSGQLPPRFIRYLRALVNHRRQMLIPSIAHEYHNLVDRVEGRVHASVTISREADEADRALVTNHLSRSLGKEVVPH